MTCHRCEKLERALRELVRVVSHQLARGEDPEEGAFDRAWVAACAALREEPVPTVPPRVTAEDFVTLQAVHERVRESGRQTEALRKELGLDPAPSAEPRSTTHHPWLTPDQFYNLGVTELPVAYADLAATVEELERRNGWLPPDEVERRIAEAWDEALEEAARVTDAARNNPDNYRRGMDAEDMAGFIIEAIRALKSKKETP